MKRKNSSPIDFKKVDTVLLFQYADMFQSKMTYGSPMIDYYRNMLEKVEEEIGRRAASFEKAYK